MTLSRTIGRSIISGSIAAIASTLALAAVARVEGKGAAQPINATSHWLYGDRAATYQSANVDHTTIGFATHSFAAIFWALFFETSLALRPPESAKTVLRNAGAISALAAIVDYTVTPKRFTPGWELVLSKRSMAVVYASMAAAFFGTALFRGAGRRRRL